MGILIILALVLFFPLLALFAWLVFSSLIGESVRASFAGISINPRNLSFGRGYSRGLSSGAGHAGWEQIEMEAMYEAGIESEDSDL
ncbi:hypothetical protein IWX90DRAFT_488591 [Phyllosticta citrichinensis]|uniref:Uncharacterized protein n=1 Tax=Phyllosticta citrichinensis TaxID=1130410 RepID=A0ABR1XPF1_9PEZI